MGAGTPDLWGNGCKDSLEGWFRGWDYYVQGWDKVSCQHRAGVPVTLQRGLWAALPGKATTFSHSTCGTAWQTSEGWRHPSLASVLPPNSLQIPGPPGAPGVMHSHSTP